MTNTRTDDVLESALRRAMTPSPVDDAAIARVLTRLKPPLPRQKVPLWRLPAVLLDWEFMPSWPRLAALACSAFLGFFVGLNGLNGIDRPFGQTASSGSDSGFYVFDSEPITGARP